RRTGSGDQRKNIIPQAERIRYRRMRTSPKISIKQLAAVIGLIILAGCGIYKFKDISLPQEVKSIKINFIENHARYINPQLSQKLTDKLRQKISQTRLRQTNSDSADWSISGWISDYSLSTSAISSQREVANRLTISVHIVKYARNDDKSTDIDVTRSFEFAASQSLQQAEQSLNDEILRSLSDDIFNR